jgi:hypothetical protein
MHREQRFFSALVDHTTVRYDDGYEEHFQDLAGRAQKYAVGQRINFRDAQGCFPVRVPAGSGPFTVFWMSGGGGPGLFVLLFFSSCGHNSGVFVSRLWNDRGYPRRPNDSYDAIFLACQTLLTVYSQLAVSLPSWFWQLEQLWRSKYC